MAADEHGAGMTGLWDVLLSFRIPIVVIVVLGILAYNLLTGRRMRQRQTAREEHEREQAMNKDIRRAATVEAMQARYAELAARKAAEAAEEQRQRRLQEAEMAKALGDRQAKSTKSSRGDFSPLMGSGPVGGFKSERNCNRRGG